MRDAFIAALLVFLWCWDYPADQPARRLVQKFSFPFLYLGLWHGWAMFAPEPIHVNRRLRAVLTFADGSTEQWSPLGPDSSRKLINMLYARSFKYEHSLLGAKMEHLCATLCEFLVRQAATAERPLVVVELQRDYRYVNPYGSARIYTDEKSCGFYRYDVRRRVGMSMPVASAATPVAAQRRLA